MPPANPDAITFSAGAFSIGILCMALGAWLRYLELSPRRWERVTGKIVSSKIDVQRTGRGGTVSIPVIEYEYRYNEQVFKSSRRRAGNYIPGKRVFADAVTARYPIGGDVTVYVNPKRPKMSALEYGVTLMSWIPLGLGLFLVVVAFLPLVLE